MLLTHKQFRAIPSEGLEDLAAWWVRITNDDGVPLFEVKRGSLFIFENENLPRVTWQAFSNMSMDAKRLFLASGVCVLTCENEDTFLVRLAEDNDGACQGKANEKKM